MSLRFHALENLTANGNIEVDKTPKITGIFASNVFTLKIAREFLSDEAYKSLVNSTKSGQKIDRAIANQISSGIRSWAESKGVTSGYNASALLQSAALVFYLLSEFLRKFDTIRFFTP